jgi:hypothetical protein
MKYLSGNDTTLEIAIAYYEAHEAPIQRRSKRHCTGSATQVPSAYMRDASSDDPGKDSASWGRWPENPKSN